MKEEMTGANEAVRELTLALMFLTRFRTKRKKGQEDPWSAWKGYDFDVMDELMEKDFIRGFARGKSVILSKKGMAEARRIIAKYGIKDWESLKGESDWPEWLESLQS
jgi:hypothetical protein